MNYKLPIEQQSKDEAENLRITWNSGPYNFLLGRTQEKYRLKANQKRRVQLEEQLGLRLPMITDPMLLELYKYACQKFMTKCNNKFGHHSGFGQTSSERIFAATIQSIIENNPKLKHLEVYPSQNHSRDLPSNFKMVVGNLVPDFIIAGIKEKRFSLVAIEIDGGSHVDKFSKDELRYAHMEEMMIFSFGLPNEQAGDIEYLTKVMLTMYRIRNGSYNDQINRAKRAIWTKTICCQLSLEEIGEYYKNAYGIELYLNEEVEFLAKNQSTPRKIKKEIAILGANKFF